jgi:PAS domain S-box-containing protein
VAISGKQCLLASALDITDRKAAEKQLEKTHSLLVLAQQSAGAAVWSWDIASGILDWSPKMFDIFGLDPRKNDASFDSWRKAMHPEDGKLAEELTNAAVRDRTRLNNVYRVILPSGEIRWINALGATTYDGDRPVWMSGICIDITERKQLEDELKIYSEGLQILVDEKTMELEKTHDLLMKQERLAVLGQMAASVSHELRNPLNVINNVAYYLKIKFPDADEKTLNMLDLLEKEVDRSDRIIGNMLSFSKQKPNLNKDMDLNDLVRTFFSAPDIIPGNVAVSLKLSDKVPTIRADAEKLRQVLDNLVSNACQAMPDGGILTVSTKVNKANILELSIKDNGCGMSEEIQSRIFEPLFSTKTTGFGLGLVIVKSLVDDHGGEIKVKSKADEGSEFIVILPIEGRGV